MKGVTAGAVFSVAFAGAFALIACASHGTHEAGASPAVVAIDAAADAPSIVCSGNTPVALTVNDYLSWCSISIKGAAASTAPSQVVCVAPGALTLTATPILGFELGPAPWHGTTGDRGTGELGSVIGVDPSATSTATAIASGTSTCVWACCPFPDGTGCPPTSQCP
jgi:hypothetical protein